MHADDFRSESSDTSPSANGGFSRNVSFGFLLALTSIALYLCWTMTQPFLSAITWAMALAVIAHPLHDLLERRTGRPNLAALLAVVLVTIILIVPGIFLIDHAIREAAAGLRELQAYFGSDRWRSAISEERPIGKVVSWLDANFDLAETVKSTAAAISKRLPKVLAASVQSLVLLIIMLFTLFYFFRDHKRLIERMIRLLPLPDREIQMLFSATADAIYATIYGRFTVATVQGALGGLMFGILGLRAPLLWALLMMLFSLVPMLGAFIIWVPAAIILAIKGSWVKALVLALWGVFVIGLIDNFLYPLIVGDRLRLHSLLVFFSALGGVAAFGTSGIVLGPVILAVTIGLLRLWQRRISVAERRPKNVA
jgi:predicted PurR-regulated permease PerM